MRYMGDMSKQDYLVTYTEECYLMPDGSRKSVYHSSDMQLVSVCSVDGPAGLSDDEVKKLIDNKFQEPQG
jgi:hypothetical protein